MKKPTSIHKSILKSEAKIQRLHHLISSTFAKRDDNRQSYESWQNACTNFHQSYSTLVFHSDNFEGEEYLVELITHDSANGAYAREFAVCFIELRPYHFRSGYLYKRLLRKLKHAPLTQDQLSRYDKIKQAYQQYRHNRINNS